MEVVTTGVEVLCTVHVLADWVLHVAHLKKCPVPPRGSGLPHLLEDLTQLNLHKIHCTEVAI